MFRNFGRVLILIHLIVFGFLSSRVMADITSYGNQIAVDPAGRFVLFAGPTNSCSHDVLLFVRLDGSGNPLGSPNPLISCSLLSSDLFGLDILREGSTDLYWIAFGGALPSDKKFILQIDATGMVTKSPVAVVPAEKFESTPGALAMAAKGSRKILFWIAGANGSIHKTLIDKISLTLLSAKKTSLVTQDGNSIQATQRSLQPDFLAFEKPSDVLKAFGLTNKGLPDGTSWRLSPRTDGSHKLGGVSADGIMAFSNDSDPPVDQIYIQPLQLNGLPNGDPSVSASGRIRAADVSNAIGASCTRYLAYMTETEVYVQRIDCVTGAKQGAGILVASLPLISPVVESFLANPNPVCNGDSTNLSWTTRDANSCSIDNTVGTVSCDGNVDVLPVTPETTYTLTAGGPGGTTTATETVIVNDPPTPVAASGFCIQNDTNSLFQFSISFINATSCSWNNGIGVVPCSSAGFSVSPIPAVATTYTLTAISPGCDPLILSITVGPGC